MPWSPPRHIRPIAICVVRHDDRILVFEGHDPTKRETFYRPLGGGIEFGELGHEAVAREVREELGAEIRNVRYLGALENIFTYDGHPGHEIVLVYEAELTDEALYASDRLIGHEENGAPFHVVWKPLADFKDGSGSAPLYPEQLLRLLTTTD